MGGSEKHEMGVAMLCAALLGWGWGWGRLRIYLTCVSSFPSYDCVYYRLSNQKYRFYYLLPTPTQEVERDKRYESGAM